MGKDSPSSPSHLHKEGLPLGLEGNSAPPANTKFVDPDPGGPGSSSDTLGFGGHLRGGSTTVLPLSHLCGAQGARGPPSDPRCVGPELLPRDSVLQDVESLVSESGDVCPILDGQPGFEGCLSPCTDETEPTQVSGSFVLGQAVLLPGSSIRASHGALALLSSDRSGTKLAQSQGVQHLRIHRRSGSLEQGQGITEVPCPRNHLSPREARSDPEYEEVTSFSDIISSLGGSGLGCDQGHVVATAETHRRDNTSSQPSARIPKGLKEKVGKLLRPRSLRISVQQKSKALHASYLKDRPLQPQHRQRCMGQLPLASPRGTGSLDKDGLLANSRVLRSSSKLLPMLDGRVQKRLGLPGRPGKGLERPLVKGAKPLAHKRPGAAHNSFCGKGARVGKPDRYSLVRQPNSYKCDPETRFSLPRSSKAGRRPAPGLRGQEVDHQATTHQGILERGSRLALKRASTAGRMGVERRSARESGSPARTTSSSRPLRLSSQLQAPDILLPVRASPGLGSRRSCTGLEQIPSGPNLPASKLIKGGSKEASDVQGRRHPDSPGHSSFADLLPVSASSQGTSSGTTVSDSDGRDHPSIGWVRAFSRLEFLRAIYQRSYKGEVVDDLLSHLAASSLRQYESAWKRFQEWLPREAINIDIPLVASFLVFCNQNLSPRTVLTIRAALALPLNEGFGIDFEHRHFKMLAKAAFRRKPPEQKIVPTWSLDDALKALSSRKIPFRDKLSRFKKTLFLVAMASSNRSCELAAIDRSNIVFRQNSVTLPVKPGFIFKNQAQFHAPSLIEIPDLPGSSLCPVKALRDYLGDTSGSPEGSLFIHPRSGKPLNAGRVAFFLAKAINWLVPDSLARAHDSRRLSTTLAFYLGVPSDRIVAAGSWRSSSTFAKRYCVPLKESSNKSGAVLARTRC